MADLNNLLNKYPGNERVYERVKNLLAERSAIAFIGAGASFPLYPLWDQIIKQLADETANRGLATQEDKAYWLRDAAQRPLQVATQIHKKLGDAFYHEFLHETFKTKTGADDKKYTLTQAALMRINFKAYITTNYDPGLTEARREIRPEIGDTGFVVWNHDFQINRWASGDFFHEVSRCPVLFAHGHFTDPPNIILDHASYRKAYHGTPYRRLFENLWFQEHMVFVGFGFADMTLTQIADEVLWQTARQHGGAPRHIAIVGLSDNEPYSDQMRHEFLEAYHAEIIFYPVNRTNQGLPDHSALHFLLHALSYKQPSPRVSSTSSPNETTAIKEIATKKRDAITKYAEQVFGLMCEGRFSPEKINNTDSATLKEWHNGVMNGWKEAQWLMGLCYRFGIGDTVKLDKAAELFEKSAEQGYVPAALCLDFERQLADSIYRASNGGQRSFRLEDVRAIALSFPWPGPSYKDDNMEILPCARIAEKVKDRAASGRYFETTSGQRFVVVCPTNPEFLGVECSIRKYSV